MFRVDHNTIIQVKKSIYRIRITQIQVSIISYGVLDIWPCEKMNNVPLYSSESSLSLLIITINNNQNDMSFISLKLDAKNLSDIRKNNSQGDAVTTYDVMAQLMSLTIFDLEHFKTMPNTQCDAEFNGLQNKDIIFLQRFIAWLFGQNTRKTIFQIMPQNTLIWLFFVLY